MYYNKCLRMAHVEEIQLKFCIEALRAELWRERLLISFIRRNSEIPVEFNAKKDFRKNILFIYTLLSFYIYNVYLAHAEEPIQGRAENA